MRIVRSKGGSAEREVELSEVEVPDLWHIMGEVRRAYGPDIADRIGECWHLCHDLLRALREQEAILREEGEKNDVQ